MKILFNTSSFSERYKCKVLILFYYMQLCMFFCVCLLKKHNNLKVNRMKKKQCFLLEIQWENKY